MARRRGKGEGSVYQRGSDGRWVAELDLGSEGTRRNRKQFYGKTQREAIAKRDAAKRNLALDRPVTESRQTLADFLLSAWLRDSVDPSRLKPATKASYRYIVELHVTPTIGHVPLDRLRPQHIQSLIAQKRNEGLSERTCQLIHAVLRRALGHAQRCELVGRNVATLVDAPRPTRDSSKVHALAFDDAQKVLRTAEQDRLYALWTVLLLVGLRKGETLALRWSDIDLSGGTVNVERTVSRVKGFGIVFGPTKTQASARRLPLPSLCVSALQAHKVAQATARLSAGPSWHDEGLVFTTRTGRVIEPSSVNRQFNRLCARAGLPHERVHNLRHTVATVLLVYGEATLLDVKDLLGHSTLSVTADLYAHAVEGRQRESAERMTALYDVPVAVRLAVTEPDGSASQAEPKAESGS